MLDMSDQNTLEFSNLDFKVPSTLRRANKDQTPPEPIHILNNVSGSFKPRRLTCVMGPSGSGKTTLLNLIAGRQGVSSVPGSSLGGSISLSGIQVDPTKHRDKFAYVMAHDALYATLSPRETFRFALVLSGAPDLTEKDIEEKVEYLINRLRLTSCADTMVGDLQIKGLSSGEKKRVSVGMELIHDPNLLLLDECTSGLDSFSALLLVQLLKSLADSGRTIVTSIHQPSSEIFQSFDDVCFMSKGEVIYFGPVVEVPGYFAKLGHPCPADSNPSDHVMYLLQTLTNEELSILAEKHRSESQSSVVRQGDVTTKQRRHVGFWTQFKQLGIREWRNFFRDTGSLVARINIAIILILIISFVFWFVGDNSTQDQINISHIGAVTLLTVNAMFTNSQIMMLSFPSERPVFLKEYAAGMYSIPAYFLSKSVVEFPVLFAQVCLSTVIAYFLMALGGSYIGLVYALFLVSIASASIALVIASVAGDARRAMELTPIIFVPQIFFSGFFVPMSSVPAVLRWGQYLCSLKYAINIAFINVFSHYDCAQTQIFGPNDIKTSQEWLYALILVIITIFFRIIAMLALKSKAKQMY